MVCASLLLWSLGCSAPPEGPPDPVVFRLFVESSIPKDTGYEGLFFVDTGRLDTTYDATHDGSGPLFYEDSALVANRKAVADSMGVATWEVLDLTRAPCDETRWDCEAVVRLGVAVGAAKWHDETGRWRAQWWRSFANRLGDGSLSTGAIFIDRNERGEWEVVEVEQGLVT